jgi:N-carbamoyl-L-amino-acid hydrolase
MEIKISKTRLDQRLADLAKIGARPDGGVCRLALSDEDKSARDLVVKWMKELNLLVHADQVGNLIGIRPGRSEAAPLVMGSHIDTVPTGGRFDGAVGVMAGLEVLETLNDASIQTDRPIALVAFTNEEGVRYRTDMLGSRAFCGFLPLDEAFGVKGTDGTIFGDELKRIGYAGDFPCGSIHPYAYLELHIEQGPVLDREKIQIGAVEAITGISWHEVTVTGEANHAGTTPIYMRRDAGLTAAHIITYMREIANTLGANQRATCGMISFSPNAINVIPAEAVLSIDLRNSDESILKHADLLLEDYLKKIAQEDGTLIKTRRLAWVKPEVCHPNVIATVTEAAQELGYSHLSMISGAVHDALMLAKYCPTGMIFVPSKNGISHNAAEYTTTDELEAGANVLLRTILKLSTQAALKS